MNEEEGRSLQAADSCNTNIMPPVAAAAASSPLLSYHHHPGEEKIECFCKCMHTSTVGCTPFSSPKSINFIFLHLLFVIIRLYIH
jgi:hypothetical protein